MRLMMVHEFEKNAAVNSALCRSVISRILLPIYIFSQGRSLLVITFMQEEKNYILSSLCGSTINTLYIIT